jgi:hypothetical protein
MRQVKLKAVVYNMNKDECCCYACDNPLPKA